MYFYDFLLESMFFLSAKGQVGELAETTSLLRMRSRKITEGSNPSLSATLVYKPTWLLFDQFPCAMQTL